MQESRFKFYSVFTFIHSRFESRGKISVRNREEIKTAVEIHIRNILNNKWFIQFEMQCMTFFRQQNHFIHCWGGRASAQTNERMNGKWKRKTNSKCNFPTKFVSRSKVVRFPTDFVIWHKCVIHTDSFSLLSLSLSASIPLFLIRLSPAITAKTHTHTPKKLQKYSYKDPLFVS